MVLLEYVHMYVQIYITMVHVYHFGISKTTSNTSTQGSNTMYTGMCMPYHLVPKWYVLEIMLFLYHLVWPSYTCTNIHYGHTIWYLKNDLKY
jgi:hypothetical protein